MGSSPPSPELDLPPRRFIATAITSWHSREMAPRDMPPVQKRDMMSPTDSTSSMGTGAASLLRSRQSRRTLVGRLSRWSTYVSYAVAESSRTAVCSSFDISGLLPWYSPLGRVIMKPKLGSLYLSADASVKPRFQKVAASLAMSSSDMPPMRETEPLNPVSSASPPMPYASKICAPWYDESSEMPILDRIFFRPALSALRKFSCAPSMSICGTLPRFINDCVLLEAHHERQVLSAR
mmetsp:Transcript_10760/g.44502  ORF Transcript_10760/g.44502 Transcript_10760/m.44502 type:complete len:236 (+) Transcript_10760:1930-2637(+)